MPRTTPFPVRLAACLALLLLGAGLSAAQTDTTRHFTVKAQLWARGEVRDGALPAENGKDYAAFLMGNSIVRLDYTSSWLDVRFAPRFSGIWGSNSTGGLDIDEAWIHLHTGGFFARLGRQKVSYDDDRVIGSDDWSMAPLTHDMVKLGFEGGKHKVHLMLAFNQNDEDVNGGTYYVNGGQVYKTMQTLWYHVDPTPWLGASLVGINMGLQSLLTNEYKTRFQQLFGTYVDIHPDPFRLELSYYRQTGHNEYAMSIHAWMASAEAGWQATPQLKLRTGYFYMSGDPLYYVPKAGEIGLIRKTEIRGFDPVFGAHHKFYGAMDFFYVSTFYGGNTPGLQDFHVGARWCPWAPLDLDGSYHFLATSVDIKDGGKILGHELELTLTWRFAKDAKLSAGYSYMNGTDTMARLKRTSDQNHLHWGWLMLTVTPEFFKR